MSLEFSKLKSSLSLDEISFNDICSDISDIIPWNNQVWSIWYDIRNKVLSAKDLEKLFTSKKFSFRKIFEYYHEEFKNLTYHILDIKIPNLASFKRSDFIKLILLYSFINKYNIEDDANIFPVDLFYEYINIFLQIRTVNLGNWFKVESDNISTDLMGILELKELPA